ncbi:hypothetical protein Skr01_28640 [Sphaerisporangium krabiense]|uniref:Uncharacterized protein n=1 Tax=Sphaerisporangium krabiense TaxID=763782 RepID=A0A7W8ZAE1_9ACTN|nr:hypothetical protein [Sphaerisporangium krabiense]MBB5630270.1 hypothetical protein [Sphaerisporangium krabiense]GII62779.1 hypothetical protein Skr01_28640 [Sphaerisporangium krabiense]
MAGALAYYAACRARLAHGRPRPRREEPPLPSDPPAPREHVTRVVHGAAPAGPARRDVEGEVGALRRAHPGWRVWVSGPTWYACGPWLEARLVHAPTAEGLSALIAARMEGSR